jgi:recombinational DNA repair ATPase RecF
VRLTGVRLKNWKRYRGEHELELQAGVYALVARDAENPDRSNWLGKSSFIEAVWYGLTGEVPKDDTVDSVVSHGEQEMAVDLEFDDGTFVARDRDVKRSTSKLKVVVLDGKGGELELAGDGAQETLHQRMGITKKDLKATCFVRQKQMAKLVTEDPAEVSSVINGWLDMARVEKAADALARSAAEVERRLEDAAAKLASSKSTMAGMLPEAELRAEEQRLLAVLEEQQAAAAVNARYAERRLVREREHAAWRAARESIQRRALARADLDAAETTLREFVATALDQEHVRRREAGLEECVREEAETRAAEQRARPMAAGAFDGVCPVAGIDCPAKAQINSMRAEGRARLDTARAAAGTAQEAVRLARAALAPCQAAARRRAELEAAVAARRGVLNRQPEQADPGPEPEALPAYECVAADPASVTTQLAEVKARLIRLEEVRDAITERAEQVELLRDEAEAHRLAVQVLGRKGAQRVIAQRACVVLEHGANERLARAGVDLRVTLAWGRETQQLEQQCAACGLAYPKSARVKKCERCGAERGLKSDEKFHVNLSARSGAADDLAGLALQLTAASWLRSSRGSPWSVLVLDEPLASLDAYNRKMLVASLAKLIGDGFDQAFVVSHDRMVQDALPMRVEIVAEGKWSKVVVG